MSTTLIQIPFSKKVELPVWTEGPASAEEIGRWNDIMVDTGALPNEVDVQSMILGG